MEVPRFVVISWVYSSPTSVPLDYGFVVCYFLSLPTHFLFYYGFFVCVIFRSVSFLTSVLHSKS